ncbi:MAG: winged helix-turn-helix transcriptional regulator [Nocardioidaceae bacterium]|nr:winged helix-turn-helix transcriptional regulator [Nocardioidaceae bacterium]
MASQPAALDLGHWLRAVRRRHWASRGAAGEPVLTPTQFAALLAVCQVPGADQRTVSVLASIDQATVSETLRRLQRDGLVRIEPDLADARRLRIWPHEAAVEVVRTDLIGVREADRRLLSVLTDAERDALIDALRTIAYASSDDPAAWPTTEVPAEHGLLTVEETSRAFGRLVRICSQQHQATWTDVAGTLLTPQQFTLLALVAGTREVRQSEIPAALDLDKASVTGLLHRLARRDLVVAVPSGQDRRQRVVTLTPLGLEVLKVSRSAAAAVEAAVVKGLDPAARRRLPRHLEHVVRSAAQPG